MYSITGGSLKSNDLKLLLNASYDKKLNDVKDFKVDKKLSGQRVKVFRNDKTGQTVVSHRGTNGKIHDLITDGHLLFDNLKNTNRFKHSKKIHQKAVDKYGRDGLISIGHSLSGQLAEKTAKGKNEVITLNKPVIPADIIKNRRVSKNQTDIRTSGDAVSLLRPLQKGKKAVTIPSNTINPLKEHSTETLNKLDNVVIGGKIYTV